MKKETELQASKNLIIEAKRKIKVDTYRERISEVENMKRLFGM